MKTNIAQTILNQLGGSQFVSLVEAEEIVDGGNQLTVWIRENPKRITFVRIILNRKDLYTMEFVGKRKGTYELISQCKKVKPGQLNDLFEKGTGLLSSIEVA